MKKTLALLLLLVERRRCVLLYRYAQSQARTYFTWWSWKWWIWQAASKHDKWQHISWNAIRYIINFWVSVCSCYNIPLVNQAAVIALEVNAIKLSGLLFCFYIQRLTHNKLHFMQKKWTRFQVWCFNQDALASVWGAFMSSMFIWSPLGGTMFMNGFQQTRGWLFICFTCQWFYYCDWLLYCVSPPLQQMQETSL